MDKKYKDRDPFETIAIVKDFLLRMHILVTEQWFYDQLELYSVGLTVDGTTLHVNGKGTSKLYALASGYGELMERLQTMALFRIQSSVLNSVDAIFDQKDSLGSTKGYKNALISLQKAMPSGSTFEIHDDLLIQLSNYRYEGNNIRYSKFDEYNKSGELNLPYDLVDYYYGSNGMVAGNTLDEALVQGLSEVCERYVAWELMKNNITPPVLNEEAVLREDTVIWIAENKKRIEQGGKFKIRLLDFSLGKSIPAVGLTFYDVKKCAYLVKIGVHPILDIAVERCFTELMQGKTMNTFYGLTDISETYKKVQDANNPSSYFINSEGAFPLAFFGSNPSYKGLDEIHDFKNNIEMKEYLVKLIEDMGYRIFCRDYSRTDIIALQIIVPGMSELHKNDRQYFEDTIRGYKLGDYVTRKIEHLSHDDALDILNILDEIDYIDESETLMRLTRGLTIESPNIYTDTSIIIFRFYLYIYLKDYKNALNCLEKYNDDLRRSNKKNMFFDCFASYLSGLLSGIAVEEVRAILSSFYNTQLINAVEKELNSYPFRDFKSVNCNNNCEQCGIKSICLRKNELAVLEKYIELYGEKIS